MRSTSNGFSPRKKGTISVSIRFFVTLPPNVSPKPTSPSAVSISTISRVQSALAPPDQRIGARSGMFRGGVVLRASVLRASLPQCAPRNGNRLAGYRRCRVRTENSRRWRNLRRRDKPLLRHGLRDKLEILLNG